MATGQSASEDGGIQHGRILRRYAVSILNPEADVDAARSICVGALGKGATAQAASIVACFDGINRIADATGIRLDPETVEQGGEQIIRDLGYEKLGTARA